MSFNRTAHWQKIYTTKELDEVSWYQPKPETSLQLLAELHLPHSAPIIDIGGGDSFLVDNLLELGYADITVLDISEAAIQRAKERLGAKAENVRWIIDDASTFKPSRKYAVWHDRAAFHFLTDPGEIAHYTVAASESLETGGHVILGTFSENGPKKCSGIEIRQYSAKEMEEVFAGRLKKQRFMNVDHKTPFNTIQNFTFCVFKK